jgi:hypothetical protein
MRRHARSRLIRIEVESGLFLAWTLLGFRSSSLLRQLVLQTFGGLYYITILPAFCCLCACVTNFSVTMKEQPLR